MDGSSIMKASNCQTGIRVALLLLVGLASPGVACAGVEIPVTSSAGQFMGYITDSPLSISSLTGDAKCGYPVPYRVSIADMEVCWGSINAAPSGNEANCVCQIVPCNVAISDGLASATAGGTTSNQDSGVCTYR
jgi:hypothetical protein